MVRNKGVGRGVGGSTPAPLVWQRLCFYSRYSLICRKKQYFLFLASSAIVITSQHKPTILALLNYEVSLLRHNNVYRSCTIIKVTKSVGPWPLFMNGKVRTTANVVDTIRESNRLIFPVRVRFGFNSGFKFQFSSG